MPCPTKHYFTMTVEDSLDNDYSGNFLEHVEQVESILDILETASVDELIDGDTYLVQAYLQMVKRRSVLYSQDLITKEPEKQAPPSGSKRRKVSSPPPYTDVVSTKKPSEKAAPDIIDLCDSDDGSKEDLECVEELPLTKLLKNGSTDLGKFYLIRTIQHGEVKFYPRLPQLTESFEKDNWVFPTDFPKWCAMVSKYCNYHKFDDIAKGNVLTTDEEVVLCTLLEKVNDVTFKLPMDFSGNASECFAALKQQAMMHFTRDQKDKEWLNVVADETIGDPRPFVSKLKWLLAMEECMEDNTVQVVNDRFIFKKLLETLTPTMRGVMLAGSPHNKNWSQFGRLELVDVITRFLRKQLCDKKFINTTCGVCGSSFHSKPNCPLNHHQ